MREKVGEKSEPSFLSSPLTGLLLSSISLPLPHFLHGTNVKSVTVYDKYCLL